jgi:hypothetical protein
MATTAPAPRRNRSFRRKVRDWPWPVDPRVRKMHWLIPHRRQELMTLPNHDLKASDNNGISEAKNREGWKLDLVIQANMYQ